MSLLPPMPRFMDVQGCKLRISVFETSSSGNPLHIAAQLGDCDAATEILKWEPKNAKELNKEGLTPLHLSCMEGHLEITERLVKSNRELCVLKDKYYGNTPLHAAAMKGRVDVVKVLLEACPESVKQVSTATGQTCLHTAVVYNKFEVIHYLLKWLGEDDYSLFNAKDRGGNTALHLATSRKQLQASL